jgi:hypothetical protein
MVDTSETHAVCSFNSCAPYHALAGTPLAWFGRWWLAFWIYVPAAIAGAIAPRMLFNACIPSVTPPLTHTRRMEYVRGRGVSAVSNVGEMYTRSA